MVDVVTLDHQIKIQVVVVVLEVQAVNQDQHQILQALVEVVDGGWCRRQRKSRGGIAAAPSNGARLHTACAINQPANVHKRSRECLSRPLLGTLSSNQCCRDAAV